VLFYVNFCIVPSMKLIRSLLVASLAAVDFCGPGQVFEKPKEVEGPKTGGEDGGTSSGG
jgi:hypothetical protein